MPAGIAVIQDVENLAIAADQETHPSGMIALGHPHTISLGHFPVQIREQREIQRMLLDEPLVRRGIVETHPHRLHPLM